MEVHINSFRYRLIDTDGYEIGIINNSRRQIQEGEQVQFPDGTSGIVVEVYDEEDGKEGNVEATLVIEE